MIKHLYLRIFSVGLCLAGALCFSCSSEVERELESFADSEEVPAEVVDKLTEIGFIECDIERDGQNYIVEGDIIVTPEALAEMSDPVSVPGPLGEEQYRTCNLVSYDRGGRVIKINGSRLRGSLSTGLDWAIYNYNILGLYLTFQRVSSGPADITIYTMSGNGGLAGFPSGGNPYASIFIGMGLYSYNANVSEHVFAHEIGHCIGMRHTDYFDTTFSCGSFGGDEGQGSYCAIGIPGTPSSFDSSSLFNACFTFTTNGEFSYYDRIALDYLY